MVVKKYKTVNEPLHDKTNKMTCSPNEDSDKPMCPPSLIRAFVVYSLGSLGPKLSSLGAHLLLLVLSCCVSNNFEIGFQIVTLLRCMENS